MVDISKVFKYPVAQADMAEYIASITRILCACMCVCAHTYIYLYKYGCTCSYICIHYSIYCLGVHTGCLTCTYEGISVPGV